MTLCSIFLFVKLICLFEWSSCRWSGKWTRDNFNLTFLIWSSLLFFNLDFSLLTWKMDRSLGAGDIPDVYLLQLLEETGLAGYVKQPTCDKTAGVYTGATNGWTKGKQIDRQINEHSLHCKTALLFIKESDFFFLQQKLFLKCIDFFFAKPAVPVSPYQP